MKFFKHLMTFIVSLLLFLTIFGYTIILNVKDVVQNQLIGEVLKQTIHHEGAYTDEETKKMSDTIYKITSADNVDEIINSIIGEVDNLSKGKDVSDSTIDLVIKFWSDHIDEINELSKDKYTLDEINSVETRNNLRGSIKAVYEELSKDDSKAVVRVVTTYGTVTSKHSTLYVIGIIVVLTVLLAVINLSPYKWIKPFGIVFAVSGSLVSFVYLFFNVAYNFIVKNVNLDIKIDTKTIMIYGVGEIVFGIIVLIIYSIINRMLKNERPEEPNLINNDLSI